MEAIDFSHKLKRETPPIALMCEGGKVVEKPTNQDIINEIDLVIIPQIRVCYDLAANEGLHIDLQALSSVLFVVMERLECLLKYIDRGV